MKLLAKAGRIAWILPLLAFLGCAGSARTVRQVTPEEAVEIEAGSFYFRPNVLEVPAPGPLVLRVENVAGMQHNITIEDPEGTEIVNRDLPPGETIELTVELGRPGTYNFRCDIGLHDTLGMRGTIEVAASP